MRLNSFFLSHLSINPIRPDLYALSVNSSLALKPSDPAIAARKHLVLTGHGMQDSGLFLMPSSPFGKTTLSSPKHSGFSSVEESAIPVTLSHIAFIVKKMDSSIALFEFTIHLTDETLVCKAEIPVITDYEMLMNCYSHYPARKKKPLGNCDVLL